MLNPRRERMLVLGLIALYLALNLLVLTRTPLMHSDESWLAGLTRNMLAQGNPGVTEPFFDLKPRYPHAVKILFHLLQMPFLLIFGYHLFAVRMLSLLAGGLALYLFYRWCRQTAPMGLSLLCLAAAGLNGQFLAASHTARQEILLLCLLLGLAVYAGKHAADLHTRHIVRLGLLTGLGAGLHPNGFLLALGCGLGLLFIQLGTKRVRIRALLLYAAVTGLVALVFVFLSFQFDPQFPTHYRMYGETEFDLDAPAATRLAGFLPYLQKLWLGQSGTYLLPLMPPLLIGCAVLLLWGGIAAIRKPTPALLFPLGMVLGTMLGTALIGRYNQLSAILWMFPCLLLLAPLLQGIPRNRLAAGALALVYGAAALPPVLQALPHDYEAYLQKISTLIPADARTIANLNTGFYFENDALLDVRNLSYLKANNLTFAEYVRSRNVRYILWSDEMDLIYRNRPTLNALYGNPRYVEEVETFLRDHCELLGTFTDDAYASRLVQAFGTPCTVRAYRVFP